VPRCPDRRSSNGSGNQRFIADIKPDRIRGRWEASDDQGNTWRKDFDLTYERTQANSV
jgi:hypothetical protein